MTRKMPNLRGVMINVNDKMTNVILGSYSRPVYGEDHLVEEIEGVKYRISPQSFFQVNPAQTGTLFKVLDEYLDPNEGDVVLDAYCGVGAISLWLAKKVRTVIGIEEITQAKKDALASAAMNNIGNMEFHTGQVERILPEIYHKGMRMDKLVLDPPRRGCEEEVLDLIAKMRIQKVAYVSCNPATFARDLAILRGKGYSIEGVSLVDMFPQTYHMECVAQLSYQPTTFIRRVTMETPGDRETISMPALIPMRETEPGKLDPPRRGPSYHKPTETGQPHNMAPRKADEPEKKLKRKFFGSKVITREGRKKAKNGQAPETASLTLKSSFKRQAPETATLESLDKIRKEKLIKKAEESGDMKILDTINRKKKRLRKAPETGDLSKKIPGSERPRKAPDTGELGAKPDKKEKPALMKAPDTGALTLDKKLPGKKLRKAPDTGDLDEKDLKKKKKKKSGYDTGDLEDLEPREKTAVAPKTKAKPGKKADDTPSAGKKKSGRTADEKHRKKEPRKASKKKSKRGSKRKSKKKKRKKRS